MTKNLKKNYLTNEELVINILINDIYKLEETINTIKKTDNSYNSFSINNNMNISKLSELKKNKNILKEKIKMINNKNKDEIDYLKDKINTKKSIVNESSEKINEYKRIINSYNNLKFKNINKDIKFNKQNEFLTKEQIDDILYNSYNNKDNISKIMKKIEINKASENVVMNNINILKNKICNINEILLMLNEDKICTDEDLVNLISCKESLDNIIKYISLNLNRCILNHFNNINSENIDTNILLNLNRKANIEIYYYELSTLDINLTSIKLCKELFEIFDLNNRNEISKFTEIFKNWKRSKSIRLNSPIINNITNIYQSLSNFPHLFYTNKNEELVKDNNIESINLLTSANIHNNKKDYKKSFIKIIKKEVNNFINMKNKMKVKNFLENLSIILINKLKTYNVFLPSSEILILYLSFFFKIVYYENMINKYFTFINKEYETDKKKGKELISIINNEISKLKIKEEEINDEKMINEENLKFIKNNNLNYLLPNEQTYIQINMKANELIKRNEILNEEIMNEEKSINLKEIMIKNEKNVINNKINIIDKRIEEIKENENRSIAKYQKKILEKYDLIKKQLKIYKNKQNANISRYNNIIGDINKIISNNNRFIRYKECQCYFNKSINKLRNSLPNNYSNFIKDSNKEKYRSKTIYQNDRRNNLYYLMLSNKCDKLDKKKCNSTIKKRRKNKNFIFINPNPMSRNIQNYNYSSNYFQSQKEITVRNNNMKLFDYTTKTRNRNSNNIFNSSIKSKKSNKTHSFFYKQNKNKSSSVDESISSKNIKEYTNSFNIKGIHIFKISDLKGKNKINLFRNKNTSNKEIIYYENNKENSNLEHNYNDYKRSNNKSISSISRMSLKEEYYISKLKSLTKMTLCYYREIKKNLKGYNPLLASDLSYSDLIDYPYFFIKSTISLSKSYNSIKIIPSNKNDSIDINLNQIMNTIVTSEIKIIIDIYRGYNKKKDFVSKDEFISYVQNKYNNNLTKEEIQKCIENKNFNFFLSVNKEKRYEFILCSYNDFKLWINGLAFIIKNKKEILNFVLENNIIKK